MTRRLRKSPEQEGNRVLRDAKGRMLPGSTINPGGRPAIPADLKAVLAANTLPLYERGLKMLDEAVEAGDLPTASKLLLGLLKKSLPDAAITLELAGTVSNPLAGLTADQLVAIVKAGRG